MSPSQTDLRSTLLLELLLSVERNNLCVSTSCTTCGGMPFAVSVMRLLQQRGYSFHKPLPRKYDNQLLDLWRQQSTQEAVLKELKALSPTIDEELQIEAPTRYLLFSAYNSLGLDSVESALPSDCFAGRALIAMKAHYADVQLARSRWVALQVAERGARAKRFVERQVRHAERIESKRQRDLERLKTR